MLEYFIHHRSISSYIIQSNSMFLSTIETLIYRYLDTDVNISSETWSKKVMFRPLFRRIVGVFLPRLVLNASNLEHPIRVRRDVCATSRNATSLASEPLLMGYFDGLHPLEKLGITSFYTSWSFSWFIMIIRSDIFHGILIEIGDRCFDTWVTWCFFSVEGRDRRFFWYFSWLTW